MACNTQLAVLVVVSMPAETRRMNPRDWRKSNSPWKFARSRGIVMLMPPTFMSPRRKLRAPSDGSSCVTMRTSVALWVASAGFLKRIVKGSWVPAGTYCSLPKPCGPLMVAAPCACTACANSACSASGVTSLSAATDEKSGSATLLSKPSHGEKTLKAWK